MTATIPPIVKDTRSLLVQVEDAVSRFPRKHRYSLGADLREGATNAVLQAQLAIRATKDKRHQVAMIRELSKIIDRLKLQLQLSHDLQCMSLGRCNQLSVLARSIGAQCGGWLNHATHRNGQSSAAQGQRERAKTLSTPAASQEAYL